MKNQLIGLVFLLAIGGILNASATLIVSPDGSIAVIIDTEKTVTWSLTYQGRQLVAPSPISLQFESGKHFGWEGKVASIAQKQIKSEIIPTVPEKFARIPDIYTAVEFRFRQGYRLQWRVYNDGVAYRWIGTRPGVVRVTAEEFTLQLPEDRDIRFPEEDGFISHSERLYKPMRVSEVGTKRMACLPVLVHAGNEVTLGVVEADLEDYPGMYLTGSATSPYRLSGIFPAAVAAEKMNRDRNPVVTDRHPWLAATTGNRPFPWRGVVIARSDGDLLLNQLVFKLSRLLELSDTDWIHPGKVAWDWWNANNLFGVQFNAGINTETYLEYIDFASENGIEYVILDEGWYPLGNLLALSPGIDMDRIIAHAREKKVGIILWVVWKTLWDQLQPALDRFSAWGIAGVKVDFMQRDDQWMVNYYWTIAREAAKRHLLVDFHGSFKPTGLRRAYPNVLTREGVLGLEHCKWATTCDPEHIVTLPFTRMLTGPMDFTPGAMTNAAKGQFQPTFNRPMSMGTRCQQLSLYVVFESPLQMLADSPSKYRREPESLCFIRDVPTIWDETFVLKARLGDYLAMARRRGNQWWIAGLTDWTERDLEIDFSFLPSGLWQLDLFQDGVNADRYGDDYRTETVRIDQNTKRVIHLAPGGGFAGRIHRDS